jgi:hypothetical protein
MRVETRVNLPYCSPSSFKTGIIQRILVQFAVIQISFNTLHDNPFVTCGMTESHRLILAASLSDLFKICELGCSKVEQRFAMAQYGVRAARPLFCRIDF